MSLGGIIRRVGYRVKDSLLNSQPERIYTQWNDIKATLADCRSGWARVEYSLAQCLKMASEKCSYYRPYAGKKLHDYPVTDKLGFIENFASVRNPDYTDSVVRPISTSGSTGTPFTVVQDFAKRNRVLAELQYFGEIAGYHSHEKGIFFRACHPVSYKNMFWSNVWTYDIANMSNADMERLYRLQSKGDLQMTLAYASTYDILTAYWLKKGYVGNPNVRACISGSEILRSDVRERCKKFWPNGMVYSRYSNMENGIIAQETGDDNHYMINWASYYLEVLKMDSNAAAECGELGRIVITDMFNKAFPMIRYDTGDLGKLEWVDGKWPVLASVEGRRADIIYDAGGNVVSPHSLANIFWGLEAVRQWQFHQDGEGIYRVVYVADDVEVAAKGFAERMPILAKVFGVASKFSFEAVCQIPQTASHKHKMVVQHLRHG